MLLDERRRLLDRRTSDEDLERFPLRQIAETVETPCADWSTSAQRLTSSPDVWEITRRGNTKGSREEGYTCPPCR